MLRSFMKLTDSLRKIGKMKDSITIGLLGGLLGTISMEVTNGLIFKAKKTEVTYGQMAGQLFVGPFRAKQRKNFILGEILHMVVGSLLGIPLLYIFKKTGKDHYLSKGLFASMSIWSVLYAGGQHVGLFKKLRLTKTHYSSMLNHLIYGLTSAQAMVLLADPTIFASSNEINKEVSRQVKTDANYSNLVGSNNGFEQSLPHHVVH